jgi:hypothetical protein
MPDDISRSLITFSIVIGVARTRVRRFGVRFRDDALPFTADRAAAERRGCTAFRFGVCTAFEATRFDRLV